MPIYKKYLNGVPEYLARNYWWAYLWKWGIWFFDHQAVVNIILFGQYDWLLQKTLAQIEDKQGAKILQLSCVYGKLTPELLSCTCNEVYLCDAANAQLNLTRRKTMHLGNRCHLARMNVECLGYSNDAFDQVIVFFLLHEMPAVARQNTYAEIARVLHPGGSLLVTEYAPMSRWHWLHRISPFRFLRAYFEPFLPIFLQEDVVEKLSDALKQNGKLLSGEPVIEYRFAGLYRIIRFDLVSENYQDLLR
jgi:ubiquinone/menaquinone biosynthesis C-methylase UbiE